VDVVDADSRAADDPESLAGLQHGLGDARLGADDERVKTRHQLDQLRLAEAGPELHLADLPEPGQAVLCQLVGDQDPLRQRVPTASVRLVSSGCAAASVRPSEGAWSSSSSTCSMAHSTSTMSPVPTAPRWPTRTIRALILAVPRPPAMMTP